MRRYRSLSLLWLIVALLFLPASFASATEYTPQTLEVFVSEGCPHCAEARHFLAELSQQRPQLTIVFRVVDNDPVAQRALIGHSLRAGIWPPGVPTFVQGEKVLMGFLDGEHSGPRLLQWLEGTESGAAEIETDLFGTLSVARLGLPLFTLALGLIDGFNPCAMWVLLFLLSLLVRFHDRRRMALIAGTFVFVSGAIYYAFMAAWLNLFLLIGFSHWMNLGLGALALLIGLINVKDFFWPGSGFSLSIPDTAKPGLYARIRRILNTRMLLASMAGVALLAVLVNFIELLCTAGIPAIYTAILTQQGVSSAGYYGYLALYIVGYIADDTLMVTLAVVALSSSKLTVNTGRWLKLLSGVVMLALGEIMLLQPQWLV